ncbi:MAG TPA: hypothetical protein VMP08_06010 [Anaerolineae bacterium]|nr:hypothetical protein [Anaerolineae bacterium]
MNRSRVVTHTITITDTETWTISLEGDQPIEIWLTDAEQPVSADEDQLTIAPDLIQTTGKQSDEE